jgi:glycosyltransferase involved in cell wall biosynthesis
VVITTEHSLLNGVIEGRRSTKAVRALYQGTELLNSATIAVSQEVADRLIAWGIPDRKIKVLPNGVDLEVLGDAMRHREALRRELGIADDTEVIGGIGRLAQNRRWDLLIRAVAPVLGPRRQLVLLGSGSEEQRLRDLAAALHVEQWVRLLPAQLDVVPMLSVFDVVASTAPQETFGLALLEALAAGRSVVYVHCPALDSIGQLPGSVRVPGEEGPLREALLNSLRARAEGPPRASLEHVNIRNVAAAVDNMYESYLSRK